MKALLRTEVGLLVKFIRVSKQQCFKVVVEIGSLSAKICPIKFEIQLYNSTFYITNLNYTYSTVPVLDVN